MKFPLLTEYIDQGLAELKILYPNYYRHKQSIFDSYSQFIDSVKRGIDLIGTDEFETESARLQRLKDLLNDYVIKRNREWAEYEIDFDAWWEKQDRWLSRYPQQSSKDHPLIERLQKLREASLDPNEGIKEIDKINSALHDGILQFQDEYKQAVEASMFAKEKDLLRELILINPRAAQKFFNQQNEGKIDTLEYQKIQMILAIYDQIKRLNCSKWNPFLTQKEMLALKRTTLRELIYKFYDSNIENKKVADIIDEWLKAKSDKNTTNQAVLAYHRNVFFRPNRPAVKTKTEEFVDIFSMRYGKIAF